MCQKQTAVSHGSAESEIVSLDAGLRMDGLPALQFRECVLETFLSKPALSVTDANESFRLTLITRVAELSYQLSSVGESI